jgi:hypothetical protein
MKFLIIFLQAIGGLTFIPWFILSGMSFMVFDKPQAFRKTLPWLFIIAVFSYPFIVGASYWWAWSNFISSFYNGAIFWSLFPTTVFGIGYLILSQKTDFFNKNRRI